MSSKIETDRLQELKELDILDTEEEREFTDFVELASAIAGTPISLITLLDETRQWFKAYKGVSFRETPRNIAFCDVAIQQATPLVVQDAIEDDRFNHNPLVTGDPKIRFYAGFPLVTASGNKLGTLCVIDQKPGSLPPEKLNLLSRLAGKVVLILELRRKNKELIALRTDADQKREAMNELLGNQRKMMSILAHDTRGPLISMNHLVEMLLEQNPLSAEMKDMALGLISGQLKVTLDLIDNLIAWGGTHLSAQLIEATPYPGIEVAREAIAPLIPIASVKGIAISVSVPPEIKLFINREVVRFMVRNLVHNAIKFTEQGTIILSIKACDGQNLIVVTDTGIGMTDGVREKLFSKKVPSRDGTRKEPGSGIGLVLVNDFVLKLGGKISVNSAEGKGTAITIALPANGANL